MLLPPFMSFNVFSQKDKDLLLAGDPISKRVRLQKYKKKFSLVKMADKSIYYIHFLQANIMFGHDTSVHSIFQRIAIPQYRYPTKSWWLGRVVRPQSPLSIYHLLMMTQNQPLSVILCCNHLGLGIYS